jgi:hypothetical protein
MVICHEKCDAILVMANITLAMIKPEFLIGVIRGHICYKKELRYHSKVAQCTLQEKSVWSPSRARAKLPPAF